MEDDGFNIVLQIFLQVKNCLNKGSSFDIDDEVEDSLF